MAQIIYDSRGGNTRKLAEAMAKELGVKAVEVKAASLEPDNGILFLGSGCYGGRPGEKMARFIEANDFGGRKVALFGTSGGGTGNEAKAMAEALKGKGASVIGSYCCKGKFVVFSMGHPDAADIEGAKKFAMEMSGR